MDKIEKIKQICEDALREAGYVITDYSDKYHSFIIENPEYSISIDFYNVN